MSDMEETHGGAVLLAVLVLIAVFAYCRMNPGAEKGGPPHQASAPQAEEKADSERK